MRATHHPALKSAAYERRCREVLDLALVHIPAYAGWSAYDPGPDAPLAARYAALPVLTKALMREAGPAAFTAPGYDLEQGLADGEVELVATSGTTAEVIQNAWFQPWWDRSERDSWALHRHAARLTWEGHREAILTGPRQTGFACEHGTLTLAQRTRGRFLYLNEKLSPEHWTPVLQDRMLDELALFQPAVLEANPSLLARLAHYATAHGRTVYQPGLIVLTYENPSRLARRAMGEAFNAPIASSYGSTEAGYVFMECEHGKLHQVAESCHVDLAPWDHAADCDRIRRIIVTTFNNPWRVLLRFDTGDLARLSDTPCTCGRNDGWVLDAIEGRSGNVIFAADGTAVAPGALDRALVSVPGLFDYTLTQHSIGHCSARVIPAGSDPRQLATDVATVLRKLYGPGTYAVTAVATFPPGPSGKFQRVVPWTADEGLSPGEARCDEPT